VTQTEQAAPVVAGIPFLRRGRDELAAEVRERLAAGDERGALVELLADHDDWWPFGVPDRADRERAIDAPTLREAMDHLGYGPVGDYFAFRWSDPTFLSGLGLLEHHARGAASLFELGCGIGHLLREGARRGMAVAGGDVVFSKLWLCRRFVCPQARLWCFDAADAVPLADGEVEVALCHDALHYLPDPAHAVGELRRVASTAVLVGHAHNADVDNLSGGAPRTASAWAALLPGATLYDDAQLGEALWRGEAPQPRRAVELGGAAAVALAAGRASGEGPSFADPAPGATLRPNPLVRDDGSVAWPSPRYAQEYGPLSEHLRGGHDAGPLERARRRLDLDLPEAW
jgi:SAM-dependent methyltransferase